MDFQTYEQQLRAPYINNPIDISVGFFVIIVYFFKYFAIKKLKYSI